MLEEIKETIIMFSIEKKIVKSNRYNLFYIIKVERRNIIS